MGSAADPGLRGVAARALLSELERQAKASIAATGELDARALADIIETHLDNLREREALMRYLGVYLAQGLSGSVPDYRLWNPPA